MVDQPLHPLVQCVEHWLTTHPTAFQALSGACIDWLHVQLMASAPDLSEEARILLAITLMVTVARCMHATLDEEGASDADANV